MPRKTKELNEEKEVKKLEKSKKVATTKTEKALKTATKKASTSRKSKKNQIEEEISINPKTKKESTNSTASKIKSKKAVTKSASTSKTTKKSKSVTPPANVEYYDLPYKYNQTIVKILYQNPTTLFVYWEISDKDISHYKELYGDNFFEITRPVLIVYNNTMHYHFEIGINDFANSWYFNINDSNCDYRVELIRKSISYNENIKRDIYISSSNAIESPNDRILFSTNEPNIVYFKNTKNNNQRKINLEKLLQKLNLSNKDSANSPIIRNIYDLYKLVYHIDNSEEFSIKLTNPSSGNPSSHSLSSRFK